MYICARATNVKRRRYKNKFKSQATEPMYICIYVREPLILSADDIKTVKVEIQDNYNMGW